MDALHYLCQEASEFFPHIETHECPAIFKAVVRILYKNRVTEKQDFGFVQGSICIDFKNTLFYEENFGSEFDAIAPPEGFVPVNAVQILRKHGIEAKGWVHEERQIGYLIVKGYHSDRRRITAIFPQMTPWKFRENPLTEWEKRFLVALLNDDALLLDMMQEYITMNRIPQQIQGAKLDKLIAGLLDVKLRDATERERSILENIRCIENQLNQYYQQYSDVCNTIVGIKANHRNDDLEDFKNAFVTNPNCHLTQVNGATFNFFLTGFVANFSEHKFTSVTANSRSHLFDYAAGLGCNVVQMRQVYNEMFIGKRYRLNVFGGFSIDCAHGTISLLPHKSDYSVTSNAIPNPHIFHYGCQGSFAQDYAKAFSEHDYLDVLDTALSEVSNVNWTDISPVFRFAEDICCCYNDTPCVWDKQDKVFITPKELAERVKANEQ